MVGSTRSAVSKSARITAVWYSSTDSRREYDTMFSSLSFKYSLQVNRNIIYMYKQRIFDRLGIGTAMIGGDIVQTWEIHNY